MGKSTIVFIGAIITVHLAITDVVRGNTLVLVAGELSQQAAHIPTAIVLVTAVSLPAVQVPVTLPAAQNIIISSVASAVLRGSIYD